MLRPATRSFRVALAALAACSGASVGAQGPGRPLPTYGGHETELFDDTLEPRALGYELEQRSTPMSDALLRERTQVGDAVIRGRVTTLTSKDEDKGRTWQIGLHTVSRLAGSGALPDDLVVELGPANPSAGLLRAWEGRLIGMTFVVFVREFARRGSPGDSDLHFHLASDGKEEAAAVRAAVAEPAQSAR